jgi:HEPN domain-containing protein
MLDASVFPDEVFGFHAQQIVEKCLRAWLCLLGQVFPYSHDLVEQTKLLRANGAEPGDPCDFEDLNPFAVQLRYSAVPEEAIERSEVLTRVRAVYEQVGSHLADTPLPPKP